MTHTMPGKGSVHARKRLFYALPAVIAAATIFYVSGLESIDLPLDQVSFNDLIFHGLAYAVFGMTLLFAAWPWHTSPFYPPATRATLIAIGVLYAASDEIHQSFVPNRSSTLGDFLADSVGLTLTILIGAFCLNQRILAFKRLKGPVRSKRRERHADNRSKAFKAQE